ncbi:MAG: ATP-dependent DNA helicase RecG [Nitrospirae bacterium]|nr:ATP-dependent DNA helicase RecG [Nitrospirota bacterium]
MAHPLGVAARQAERDRAVAGMEPFIARQVDLAEDLALSSGARAALARLRSLFVGFDRLPIREQAARIDRARALIRELAAFGDGEGEREEGGGKSLQPPTSSLQRPTSNLKAPPGPIALSTPIQYVKGVGPRRAKLLERLGIRTVEEALYYLPWRYEDRGSLTPIARLTPGRFATVCGEVLALGVTTTPRQRMQIFELAVGDGSGVLYGKWFNQPYLKKQFARGQRVILGGVVKANPFQPAGRQGRGYGLEIEHPEYEVLEEEEPAASIHTGRIVPIYRTTEGLSQRQIRAIQHDLLVQAAPRCEETLPSSLRDRLRLMELPTALQEAHFPTGDHPLPCPSPPGGGRNKVGGESEERWVDRLNRAESPAHRRLIFEELFLLELGLALRRQGVKQETRGIRFQPDGPLVRRLREALPFRLTAAQERALKEILADMAGPHPMNRLLQGDVGCGKTIVALYAMLVAVDNGYQAALMAPTEILAEQHAGRIRAFAERAGAEPALLKGGQRKRERERTLARIAAGDLPLIVGTHALIQEGVEFARLGLAVVDEQHRFGVLQRATFKAKGLSPDVLVMTATPIPRTLALTVYGDLDLSVIDELPPGRRPVQTRVFTESRRRELYRFLEQEIARGRQVYVVYPLIEESEKSDLKAATAMARHLQEEVFPRIRVGLLHGRMKGEEKDAVMGAFQRGEIAILVSTTVIEVGIDIPNATVMVVEHAERFGLTQLHQLRGRVGRGGETSHCLLVARHPLSEEARQRIEAMTRTTDGFRIAEEDLRLRGPGEFFGTRQSGLPDLRAANLLRDGRILALAREEAFRLAAEDPSLARPDYRPLRQALERRWGERLGLMEVGGDWLRAQSKAEAEVKVEADLI